MKTTVICTFEDTSLAEIALRRLHQFTPLPWNILGASESFSSPFSNAGDKVITVLCEEQDCTSIVEYFAAMGAQRVFAQNNIAKP